MLIARVVVVLLVCAAVSAITTPVTLAVFDASDRWAMVVFTVETAVLFALGAKVAFRRRR
ncbi:MAG: hypothetical protein HY830_25635 [Actinobacteria bacterium]|nr:hypothetical protein [Actinomycetota bacterium]